MERGVQNPPLSSQYERVNQFDENYYKRKIDIYSKNDFLDVKE